MFVTQPHNQSSTIKSIIVAGFIIITAISVVVVMGQFNQTQTTNSKAAFMPHGMQNDDSVAVLQYDILYLDQSTIISPYDANKLNGL